MDNQVALLSRRAQLDASINFVTDTLYVGNIAPEADAQLVFELFSQGGKVVSVCLADTTNGSTSPKNHSNKTISQEHAPGLSEPTEDSSINAAATSKEETGQVPVDSSTTSDGAKSTPTSNPQKPPQVDTTNPWSAHVRYSSAASAISAFSIFYHSISLYKQPLVIRFTASQSSQTPDHEASRAIPLSLRSHIDKLLANFHKRTLLDMPKGFKGLNRVYFIAEPLAYKADCVSFVTTDNLQLYQLVQSHAAAGKSQAVSDTILAMSASVIESNAGVGNTSCARGMHTLLKQGISHIDITPDKPLPPGLESSTPIPSNSPTCLSKPQPPYQQPNCFNMPPPRPKPPPPSGGLYSQATLQAQQQQQKQQQQQQQQHTLHGLHQEPGQSYNFPSQVGQYQYDPVRKPEVYQAVNSMPFVSQPSSIAASLAALAPLMHSNVDTTQLPAAHATPSMPAGRLSIRTAVPVATQAKPSSTSFPQNNPDVMQGPATAFASSAQSVSQRQEGTNPAVGLYGQRIDPRENVYAASPEVVYTQYAPAAHVPHQQQLHTTHATYAPHVLAGMHAHSNAHIHQQDAYPPPPAQPSQQAVYTIQQQGHEIDAIDQLLGDVRATTGQYGARDAADASRHDLYHSKNLQDNSQHSSQAHVYAHQPHAVSANYANYAGYLHNPPQQYNDPRLASTTDASRSHTYPTHLVNQPNYALVTPAGYGGAVPAPVDASYAYTPPVAPVVNDRDSTHTQYATHQYPQYYPTPDANTRHPSTMSQHDSAVLYGQSAVDSAGAAQYAPGQAEATVGYRPSAVNSAAAAQYAPSQAEAVGYGQSAVDQVGAAQYAPSQAEAVAGYGQSVVAPVGAAQYTPSLAKPAVGYNQNAVDPAAAAQYTARQAEAAVGYRPSAVDPAAAPQYGASQAEAAVGYGQSTVDPAAAAQYAQSQAEAAVGYGLSAVDPAAAAQYAASQAEAAVGYGQSAVDPASQAEAVAGYGQSAVGVGSHEASYSGEAGKGDVMPSVVGQPAGYGEMDWAAADVPAGGDAEVIPNSSAEVQPPLPPDE